MMPRWSAPRDGASRRRLSLRARLLWAFLVPLVVVLAVVGVAVDRGAARTSCSARSTRQLDAAVGRSAPRADAAPRRPTAAAPTRRGPGGPDFLAARGQGAGTLGARVVGGVSTEAGVIGDRGRRAATPDQRAEPVVAQRADRRQAAHRRPRRRPRRRTGVVAATAPRRRRPRHRPAAGPHRRGAAPAGRRRGGRRPASACWPPRWPAFLVIRRTLRPLRPRRGHRHPGRRAAAGQRRGAARRARAGGRHRPAHRGRPGRHRAQPAARPRRGARWPPGRRRETQVRQFVADASHELRTPLASIRGYAELMRRRGRRRCPSDVAHAHAPGRVRGAADVRRWSTTCCCSPGSTPAATSRWATVDLTALVVDAVSDAHAAGPDHDWQLDLPDERRRGARRRRPAAPGAGQPARQRAHAHPRRDDGDRRGCAWTDGWAVLAGGSTTGRASRRTLLAARLRAVRPRRRLPRRGTAGSTGLGLAIVHAVVAAHGGTVAVPASPAGPCSPSGCPARPSSSPPRSRSPP